jgi:transcriptional regulator with AAA-type ATPase domain
VDGLVERYSELYDGNGGAASPAEANFGKKWKGYSSVYELANGNILLFDEITELPLEQCLLYLSYRSDKNFLETLLHKEQMKRRS